PFLGEGAEADHAREKAGRLRGSAWHLPRRGRLPSGEAGCPARPVAAETGIRRSDRSDILRTTREPLSGADRLRTAPPELVRAARRRVARAAPHRPGRSRSGRLSGSSVAGRVWSALLLAPARLAGDVSVELPGPDCQLRRSAESRGRSRPGGLVHLRQYG